ncbi:RE1-silencing transcription factor [Canis lupus baileyi]|uniref:RE1-silencing transcription factor n=3 Tax=Canis lupus TaxID=9612 RepID=A0A8C0T437_CANLF|nr:RE1-silencing transcription factor [Canis lupus dingo]XP_025291392.1 RE1-silencing transcription factor [Canis lupus dingo]XP_025291393.1 RE1-silencing transcription factor [Canis lupus dingo]XP_038281884.1 RE1-silencing transcription factor [Canis lupus familiaris]XP_038281890.1 RE1-silencing transcription factor [Canis lupus familiaris]XP_038281898.1 RE1-silencing transcription factor [Canis lupus familiaris]XP_038412111.1 RE1-silencing transcription factor [Canis lupus familiaris]XP_03|eukprot:XP_539282.3 RE1-silencing transcription factor [Canis lupus familiaris]
MATQVMGQSSGGGGLFTGSGNIGMALPNDMYDLHDLSKAELAAPQLIMLANVALTGEVNGSCCDYLVGEERQMAELMPVGDNNFSDSDGEGLEESPEIKGEPSGLENMELESLELSVVEPQPVFEVSAAPEIYNSNKDLPPETPGAEDKCKNLKSKPFRCKPCQYEAESEEQFVHHIRVHSAKKFFVEESAEKQAKARESGSSTAEEGDFSKGPIRCDRCGYNTNRYDHYTAHLKHHTRAGDNERVYKCIICTYTTISEYHWRKHLRNHFPRKVYTCGKCNYFSDRKNNYVQHVRTHTGERPYKCELCPYSSSQKTHLTRHMRTHSGEKPFKCDQCSYVASNQHEVTRHARQVHNGPKPLNCPHCDYKTADRSNFKKHVELHVNPRQFNCPVCDYAASKKCNLQYHFKSKHPTCPNKTMDVSKVKLKKTKKREADLPDNNITNEKTETEQTKVKGDVAGKKNERSVKVEKKDNVSKEKKSCSNASTQVTTRTRKSAMETKEMDVHTGNNSEATGKTKKSKRRMEAEAHSLKDPVNDEEPVTKKKKKAESKSKNSQEVPKGDSKVEENKKQNTCVKKSTKKKSLKNKSSKKSSKPAQKEVAQKEPAQKGLALMEPSPPKGPAQLEPSPRGPAQLETSPPRGPAQMEPPPALESTQMDVGQMEPPPPVESAQIGSSQMEPPPPMGPVQMEVVQMEPPPTEPSLHMEPSPKKSPRKDKKEKSNIQSEMARKEQVLIEVGLVPVKDSQLLKESASAQDHLPPPPPPPPLPPPKENSKEEESKDQKLFTENEGSKEAPLQKVEVEEAEKGLAGLAAIKESANISSSEQNLTIPEGEILDAKCQADTVLCEMEMDTDENKTENPPGKGPAVEEPVSPVLHPLPIENHEAVSKTAVTSPPVTMAVNESQEMDEDEGIHSHDGSDLSDNMSEGSDDSGLNGARPVPQETSRKNAKEALAVKVGEGDFVCIFCDRSFRKEKDYSKHLNRHLVNVYFLEKAAKGQE